MRDFMIFEIEDADIQACAQVIIDANNPISEKLGFAPNADITPAVERLKDEKFADSRIFKGVSGGEIVSTFMVKKVGDEYKSFEICMMAVRPDCQKLGFGQKMLNYALLYISNQGGTGAFCAFPTANDVVGLWLEKNEFFVDGFYNLPNGEICIMQKPVQPAESCSSSCGDGCSSCSSCG